MGLMKKMRKKLLSNADHKKHLNILTALALESGATRANPIKASDIVVDEQIRLKCTVPLCGYYGRNLMCPPNVMTVEEFKGLLSKYSYGVLIQLVVPFPKEMLKIIKDHRDLSSLFQSEDFNESFNESLVPALNKLDEIVRRVEAKAFKLGHRIAVGYNVGPCMLCAPHECVGPNSKEPCHYPWKARTSLEAMGIHVFETAKHAGLEFEQPAKDKAVFNGLVLVE